MTPADADGLRATHHHRAKATLEQQGAHEQRGSPQRDAEPISRSHSCAMICCGYDAGRAPSTSHPRDSTGNRSRLSPRASSHSHGGRGRTRRGGAMLAPKTARIIARWETVGMAASYWGCSSRRPFGLAGARRRRRWVPFPPNPEIPGFVKTIPGSAKKVPGYWFTRSIEKYS